MKTILARPVITQGFKVHKQMETVLVPGPVITQRLYKVTDEAGNFKARVFINPSSNPIFTQITEGEVDGGIMEVIRNESKEGRFEGEWKNLKWFLERWDF